MKLFAPLMAAFSISLVAIPVLGANLTVTVRDIRSAEGLISIAVYDSADKFLSPGLQIRAIDIEATDGEIPIVFSDLPPGRYAIAAYHDENASGDFDTGLFGLPEEGYGFSNDARASFGPPSFSAAVVAVSSDTDARTSIRMSY